MALLDRLLGDPGNDEARPEEDRGVPQAVLRALLPVVLGMLARRVRADLPGAVRPGGDALAGLDTQPGSLAGIGGLAGLLARFSRHGHGALASSWVLQGANEPLAPELVPQIFTPQELRDVAARAGLTEDEARRGLAALLPAAVDHFTPGGVVPDRDRLLHSINQYEKRLAG